MAVQAIKEKQAINISIYEKGLKQSLLQMLQKEDKRTYIYLYTNFAEMEPVETPFHSTFIYGEVGTGKTIRAAWLMFEWAKYQYIVGRPKSKIFFISCENLLLEIKKTYDNKSDTTETTILEKYSTADLLVIDDLFFEKTTAWNYKVLHMIINTRYKQLLPTIYTSNLSLQELSKVLDDDRIPNRISHDCIQNIFHFTGQSKRVC